MANKDDYLTEYRQFFEVFAQTVNPNDQLPVKLASYKLVNVEVVGAIIDWTSQYLNQKKCPQSLLPTLIKIVIEEIRKACKKQPILCGFNPSDNAYEPLKLMQTVMAKTNEVCLRYLDNSTLCTLPTPGPSHNVVTTCAIKNTRRRMEDRHVVIHDLNTMFNIQEASPSSYYAIFDGHAGHDAAAYSAAHLHQYLAESKHFVSNPSLALQDAFCKTDALFIEKCKIESFNSGTTAVCALLRPKEKTLYVAWVGDSQALIANQGKVLQCVEPHKPCREDEKSRIEQQGGVVIFWGTWRVNGQLAVSRAIGDSDYKPYVIAIPDVREIPLNGNEDFLILACDGLWDFLSEDDAARMVYNMVCKNPDDPDAISQRLVQSAKERGSSDNISVIVVFLREPSKIAAEAHWANRNGMEAGLDNANAAPPQGNPFEIMPQKESFLFEGFGKRNGASDVDDECRFDRNGKRSASEFDEDDDLGPETDVDAVDDALPSSPAKLAANNNPNEGLEKEPNAIELEIDLDLQKQQSSEFDGVRSPREETPTPPADEVHDASAVVDNVADSGEESEDEWNYYKGDTANKENARPTDTDAEVAEITEASKQDTMSQLNPDAAEFVPVSSPTRNITSPACAALINDPVVSQSPRRAIIPGVANTDISIPNIQEFENEVKRRPSEVFCGNGHENESGQKLSSQEIMENLLNGKNLDDIEFQPTSTLKSQDPMSTSFYQDREDDTNPFDLNKVQVLPENLDEFLDMPESSFDNTMPLRSSLAEAPKEVEATPVTDLDRPVPSEQSSDLLGDLQIKTPLDETDSSFQKIGSPVQFETKSPFEEIVKSEELCLRPDSESPALFSDVCQRPDSRSPQSNKEVCARPQSQSSTTSGQGNDLIQSDSPEPETTTSPQIIEDVCKRPESVSPVPQAEDLCLRESKSPVAEKHFELTEEVTPDLNEELCARPEPKEELYVEPEPKEEVCVKPEPKEELCVRPESSASGVSEDLCTTREPKSPVLDDFCQRPESKSPALDDFCQRPECKSPVLDDFCQRPESKSPALDNFCQRPESKSPALDDFCQRPESKSPTLDNFCERPVSKSPALDDFCKRQESKSPTMDDICQRPESKSPALDDLCQIPAMKSAEPDFCLVPEKPDDLCIRPESKSPAEDLCVRPQSKPPAPETQSLAHEDTYLRPTSKSPLPELHSPEATSPTPSDEICLPSAKSPDVATPEPQADICLRPDTTTPEPEVSEINQFTTVEPAKSPELEQPVEYLTKEEVSDAISEDIVSPAEDITASAKDEIASPIVSPVPQESAEFLNFDEKEVDSGVESNEPTLQTNHVNFTEEISNAIQDTVMKTEEAPEPDFNSTPKSAISEIIDTESVMTADVNSMLEKCNLPDIASPLSNSGQPSEGTFLSQNESIDVEPKQEVSAFEPPTISIAESEAWEPKVSEEVKEKVEEVAKVTSAAAVAVAAVAAGAALTAAAAAEKKTTKAKTTPSTTPKKPTATKTTPAKAPALGAKKPAAPPSKSPAQKPLTAKPPSATKTSSATATPLASKTTPSASKPRLSTPKIPATTERKSLTNGDAKPSARAAPIRKVGEAAKTTLAAKSSPAAKTSPTKPTTRPPTAPPKPAVSRSVPSTTAPKPRTSGLNAARTSSATTTTSKSTSATTATTKPTATKTTSKQADPKPKPTTGLLKARVPLTKTITKGPEAEKLLKETANKQLSASRSTTTSRTVTSRTSTTTTSKKTEIKAATTGTIATKTTVTTLKSAPKKPETLTRLSGKTKSTGKAAPVPPQENGISVVEEITVVTTTTPAAKEDNESRLVKDNSPIDNNIIIDNIQLLQSNNAD